MVGLRDTLVLGRSGLERKPYDSKTENGWKGAEESWPQRVLDWDSLRRVIRADRGSE